MSETHTELARSISIPRLLIRITGMLQILLGLVFWSGNAKGLLPVHITSGIIFVISLWTLAYSAKRLGVSTGLVAFTAVWGLIIPALGASQTSILHGSAHWVIQVIHLLVGLTGMALAEQLVTRVPAATA
jgi:hypothetical protein